MPVNTEFDSDIKKSTPWVGIVDVLCLFGIFMIGIALILDAFNNQAENMTGGVALGLCLFVHIAIKIWDVQHGNLTRWQM